MCPRLLLTTGKDPYDRDFDSRGGYDRYEHLAFVLLVDSSGGQEIEIEGVRGRATQGTLPSRRTGWVR